MTKSWMFLTVAVAAFAGVGTQNDERLTLTIQVFDETAIGRSALRSAEEEAARIFARSGIDVTFTNCPLPDPRRFGKQICPEPDDPRVFSLWVRAEDDRTIRTTDTALGFSMPLAPRANHFSAIYPRVKEFASRGDGVGSSKVLAAVIAHELGHLLFRSNLHGGGIMRARWSETELKKLSQSQLVFSTEQSAQLRRGLLARTSRETSSGK